MESYNSNQVLVKQGVDAVLQGKAGAQAILFGSRARGDAREDSDWDVLILLDKERITQADMDEISYPIRELGWTLNEMINPIMFTKAEWEKKSFTPFYKNVTSEGIVI